MTLIFIIYAIGLFILSILAEPSSNIFFRLLILKDYKKIKFESNYYRDILKYSPSEILYIYEKGYSNHKLNEYGLINKYKKMFYINILKMYLLGYINIDFSNGDNFKITKNDVLILDEEYWMIYNHIFRFITNDTSIVLYDIYKYIEEECVSNHFFDDWEYVIRKRLRKNGFYATDFNIKYGEFVKKFYIFGCIFLFFLNCFILFVDYKTGLGYFALGFVYIVTGYYKSKTLKTHTSWSIYEYKKIKALKKFLKEFTFVDEKPPEYIKLLEDYIVYAAIFDMCDISIEELMKEIGIFLSTQI